jgi:hypothetical protein
VAADLARDCLGSGHVEVQAVKIKGSMLHVYLCPPATMEDRLRDAWRLAKNSPSLDKSISSAEQPLATHPRAALRKQRSSVDQLLKDRGWSTLQCAQEAKVDWHTADNYLKGITTPTRDTRLQLAKALNLSVNELPQ